MTSPTKSSYLFLETKEMLMDRINLQTYAYSRVDLEYNQQTEKTKRVRIVQQGEQLSLSVYHLSSGKDLS